MTYKRAPSHESAEGLFQKLTQRRHRVVNCSSISLPTLAMEQIVIHNFYLTISFLGICPESIICKYLRFSTSWMNYEQKYFCL